MRIEKEYVNTIIDCETGEEKSVQIRKEFSTKIKTDEFYMSFIEFMQPYFDLKPDCLKQLTNILCCMAGWNTGEVRITTGDRQDICEKLNISHSRLSQMLKKLIANKIIDGSSGRYIINPLMFWKGDTKSRRQILSGNAKLIFTIGLEKQQGDEV